MAPDKSPAFSFYARDFLAGTATMGLDEVGAYVKLLAYQWDAGSVPDSPRERTRILGCTAAQERAVWLRLVSKFARVGDAYQNTRLEAERNKQIERSRRLSNNGSKGGRPVKQTETNSFPVAKPNENLNKRLSSSSSSSSSEKQEEQQPHNGAPLILSPMAYERRKAQCAYVGARLEVPHGLHGDMRKLLGGANAETDLLAWYADLDAEIEASGEKITPDVFRWLKARYAQWTDAAGREKTTAEIMAEIALLPKGIGR